MLGQTFGEIEELSHEIWRFFVNYQAVDIPSIEPEPVSGIIEKLAQKLENQVYNLWIFNESYQAFLDYSKILWVKPIENSAEVAMGVSSTEYASENMKSFGDIFALHLSLITTVQNCLEYSIKLANIFLKNKSIVIIEPQAYQNFEKLAKLFLLFWALKYRQIERILRNKIFHELCIWK